MQAVDTTQIEATLLDYICSELLYDQDTSEVTVDTPLPGNLLDSLGLVNLVGFIEDEFGLAVPDEALQPENFRTVRDIAAYIATHTA
jgi:acyl carrier protein